MMLDLDTASHTLHRTVTDDGLLLAITAEEDDVHYASEHRQLRVRGIMGDGPEDVPYLHRVKESV